jgi:hypothetical protein
MNPIDIFYQAHGLREIEHIEAQADETVAAVKARLIAKHGCEADTLVFLEDQENPLDDNELIGKVCGAAGAKLHLHRCRQVEVAVTFVVDTQRHKFAPAATVARVKAWAARKFGMTEDEAGEHVLQISGTQERPAPGTHIGTLASCPDCRIRFDLVPDQRINGAPVLDDEAG